MLRTGSLFVALGLRSVVSALLLWTVIGCTSHETPTAPRWVFGSRPEFRYDEGLGSLEFQQKFAIEGVVGRLAEGESEAGSSNLFLLGKFGLPVLVDPDNRRRVELGKEYRFFGNLVGWGHKNLVVHMEVTGVQEVAPQQWQPSGAAAIQCAPASEVEISWEKAKSLIASGRITAVSQNHKLVVEFVDRDGNRYTTKEPAIDDVLKLVDQVDPKRERIQFITE